MGEGIQRKIPICIVTGFLGSGKTTYLMRIAKTYPEKRYVFLVNEFSDYDVDTKRLGGSGKELLSIVGGSIFCECRTEDFIKYLKTIRDEWDHPEKPVEGLVIETSGIANPESMQKLLEDTRLDGDFSIRSVVSIVAPGRFEKLVRVLPNLSAQIRSSDIAILNKVDTAGPDELKGLRRQLLELNPGLELIETSWCAVDLDLFGEERYRPAQGDLETCVNPYSAIDVELNGPVDLNELERQIVGLGEMLYRLKGQIQTRDGAFSIDHSVSGFETTPIPDFAGMGHLVLIVPDEAEEQAEAFAKVLPERIGVWESMRP